jgi:hypothetical protein
MDRRQKALEATGELSKWTHDWLASQPGMIELGMAAGYPDAKAMTTAAMQNPEDFRARMEGQGGGEIADTILQKMGLLEEVEGGGRKLTTEGVEQFFGEDTTEAVRQRAAKMYGIDPADVTTEQLSGAMAQMTERLSALDDNGGPLSSLLSFVSSLEPMQQFLVGGAVLSAIVGLVGAMAGKGSMGAIGLLGALGMGGAAMMGGKGGPLSGLFGGEQPPAALDEAATPTGTPGAGATLDSAMQINDFLEAGISELGLEEQWAKTSFLKKWAVQSAIRGKTPEEAKQILLNMAEGEGMEIPPEAYDYDVSGKQAKHGLILQPAPKLAHLNKHAAEALTGGKADGRGDSTFPDAALAQGIKVEREHTTDKQVAKEIAKDHLTEGDEYYHELEEMEEDLKEDKAED